jgi:hypothetical protein
MSSVVNSPEDVINLALTRIGYPVSIENIHEGSLAAKRALNIYGQTRDAVLRDGNYGFAEKIAAGVLSGGAAPQPWSFEYAYPADCLRVRNLFSAAYLADKNNPVRVLYSIGDAAVKVIWTNAVAPTLVYTARVTDPARWDSLFVESLVAELGLGLSIGLAKVDTAVKLEAETAKNVTPVAEGTLG